MESTKGEVKMNTSALQKSMRKTIDRQHEENEKSKALVDALRKSLADILVINVKLHEENAELKANSVPIDKLKELLEYPMRADECINSMIVINANEIKLLIKDIKQ